MAILEEEIKRRKAAAALLDSEESDEEETDSEQSDWEPEPADSESSDESDSKEPTPSEVYVPPTKRAPSFVLVPAPQVEKPKPKEAPTPSSYLPWEGADIPPEPKAAPPVTQEIHTAPEEEGGGRYVIDPDTGQMIPHAELATQEDKAAQPPSDVQLPKVTVEKDIPVKRAELVDPDPDLLYTSGIDKGTAPKAIGRATLVDPDPDSLYLGDDTAAVQPEVRRAMPVGVTPTAKPVSPPEATSAAPVKAAPVRPTAQPAAPRPRTSEFGLTPDEYKAAQSGQAPTGTAAATTEVDADAGPPMMNAPNGKPPVALIVHHTSGRNSAESVVDDWRTNRPGVGAQMIMDRDGTIHETNKEFGYGGTGNFLHSVIPGVSNQTAVGIEVIAKDDADMTPAQIESLKRLAGPKGPYANVPVYGHSQVSPGDRDNEGVRGVTAINEARQGGGQQPAPVTAKTTSDDGQGNFITGKATTFGHFDPEDAGVGAPRLGKINTNDPNLIGVAVPEDALRHFIGANPTTWRKARVDIVTADGRRLRVPIVDLGPGAEALQRGVATDFTYGLGKLLGHDDSNNYQFRIVPNAGPDVEKNPQAFADEQAAIAKGIYTGPQPKARRNPATSWRPRIQPSKSLWIGRSSIQIRPKLRKSKLFQRPRAATWSGITNGCKTRLKASRTECGNRILTISRRPLSRKCNSAFLA